MLPSPGQQRAQLVDFGFARDDAFEDIAQISERLDIVELCRLDQRGNNRPCNPDADSWVAEFLAWWIDPQTGLPIPERAGVLRYYVRIAGRIVWADRPEDLMQHLPAAGDPSPGVDPPRPISVTFIPASVFDNPALLQVNPDYLAWLLSLPLLERERLLVGNWKIRAAAGLYFKREWCAVVDEVPADLEIVRHWDLAATEKAELNDPDWTVGIKLGRDKNGGCWLLDMVRERANPGDVERLLLNTATQDGKRVSIGFGKDPGQAGKSQALHLVRALSGFTVTPASESGDKITRFGPFSSQCRVGNVKIRRGRWNEDLLRVLEGFPDLAHDDEADACSGALEMLNLPMNSRGIYELYRRQAEQLKQRSSSWVRLRAPRGTGAVQTYSGRHLIVQEDGTVDMSAEDAEAFIRDGWTKLEEWEPGEDT